MGPANALVSIGECTASAEYTINGAELGAGHHGIVIVAKDRAGNEGREEEEVSVRHSTPVPLGPGDVDLESGDFTLGPTDVALGGGLSVSRVYSSRDLTAGAEQGSPLGPQWSLSVGSERVAFRNGRQERACDQRQPAVRRSSRQCSTVKANQRGSSKRRPATRILRWRSKKTENTKRAYYLKDPAAGTSTEFMLSSTAKVWVPASQEGPVPTDTVSYFYETVEVGGKKITRPKEERGATPAKVSCSPKMEPGCRALKFTYATKTKSEIGEGPTEWGEYEGRLVKVSYEGYNPATKKMTEPAVPVAEYSYDKLGRLRAEWDPRLAPHELKTEYGYDSEGHVTALDPPGQEPWVFTYGTIAGDAGTGRLIKVMRAPAIRRDCGTGRRRATPKLPKITGTPLVGNAHWQRIDRQMEQQSPHLLATSGRNAAPTATAAPRYPAPTTPTTRRRERTRNILWSSRSARKWRRHSHCHRRRTAKGSRLRSTHASARPRKRQGQIYPRTRGSVAENGTCGSDTGARAA